MVRAKRMNVKLLLIAAAVVMMLVGLMASGMVSYAASKAKEMTTTMACSVWLKPDSRVEANRVKKISAGYKVTVIPDVVKGKDGKDYYKTAKGSYIMVKCFGNASASYAYDFGWDNKSTEDEMYNEFQRLYDALMEGYKKNDYSLLGGQLIRFEDSIWYGLLSPEINDGLSQYRVDGVPAKEASVFCFNYAPIGLTVIGNCPDVFTRDDVFVAEPFSVDTRVTENGTVNFYLTLVEKEHYRNGTKVH